MKVIISGLSQSAQGYLEQALALSYGEGSVDIESIPVSEIFVLSHAALKDNSVVGVVFDSVSESKADPTIKTWDKYLHYSTDDEFAKALESFYQVDLGITSENTNITTPEPVVETPNDGVEFSTDKMIIENLQAQNAYLQMELEEFKTPVSESSTVELASVKRERDEFEKKLKDLEEELSDTREGVERLRESSKNVKESYDLQSISLSNKDHMVKELKDKVAELSEYKSLYEDLEVKYDSYMSGVSDSEQHVAELEAEIARLNKDYERYSTLVDDYNNQVDKIAELEGKISEQSDKIVELSSGESQATINDLISMKKRIATYESEVIFQLRDMLNPRISVGLSRNLDVLEGFHFLFSGSDGSNKSTLQIANKLALELYTNSHGDKDVIVFDLSVNTCIDYVFGLSSLSSAVPWLFEGASLSTVLGNTSNSGIRIMSLGLDFFNDFSLIDIDWGIKLQELKDTGCEIIIVGGSIVDFVGRALYSIFEGVGDTYVVSDGLIVSSRSLLLNMRGLRGDPRIVLKRVNPDSKRFVEYLREKYGVNVYDETQSVLGVG